MFKSIQWKLVVIYIMLILLAMEVVGIFLIQSLEISHKHPFQYTRWKSPTAIRYIERHLSPVPRPQDIDDVIKGFGQEIGIAVLDESASVSTSTDNTRFQEGIKLLTPG